MSKLHGKKEELATWAKQEALAGKGQPIGTAGDDAYEAAARNGCDVFAESQDVLFASAPDGAVILVIDTAVGPVSLDMPAEA